LWAFNEECLAYAIYDAETPIVSGTGHEPDMTIADYVADKRAATPTAAAIAVSFVYADYMALLERQRQRMNHLLRQRQQVYEQRLKLVSLRLQHASPKARLDRQKEQTAAARARMTAVLSQRIAQYRQQLERVQPQLKQHTVQAYVRTQNRLSEMEQTLPRVMTQRVTAYRHMLAVLTARLHGVSPTAKLLHGFGYVEKDGAPVTDIGTLKKGDRIAVTMQTGTKQAEIL
jgi:exodeoxyribonuclease VII large subunit